MKAQIIHLKIKAMNKQYRLKKEAVKFFKPELSTKIADMGTWDRYSIDISALEEVQKMYVSYGIKTTETTTMMCGWDKDGEHFHFTLVFPQIKHADHLGLDSNKVVRKIMDVIQSDIDKIYKARLEK